MGKIKKIILRAAFFLKLGSVYYLIRKKAKGPSIFIFFYHRVAPKLNEWEFPTVSPAQFEQDMEYIKKRYEVVSLDKAVDLIKEKNIDKDKAVVTFDDGYKDNYKFAFPVLKKFKIPATFFLTTGNISKRNLFWWDEVSYCIFKTRANEIEIDKLGHFDIGSLKHKTYAVNLINEKLKDLANNEKLKLINDIKHKTKVDIEGKLIEDYLMNWHEVQEMHKGGMDFQAHTANHPILSRLNKEDQEKEIIDSMREIERKIGKVSNIFAYPNGRKKDYSEDTISILKKNGFKAAVTTTGGFNDPSSNLFEMKRGELLAGEEKNLFFLHEFKNYIKIFFRDDRTNS